MVEPLASNPPAWIYRKLIRPSHRDVTSEETPIRVCDLQYLRSHFAAVEWRGLFLTVLHRSLSIESSDQVRPHICGSGLLRD